MTGSQFLDWALAIIWIVVALTDGILFLAEPGRHELADFGSSVLLSIVFTAGAMGRLVVVSKKDPTP